MSEFLDKTAEQEAELDRKIEQLVNQKVIDLYNRSGKKIIQPPYKKSDSFVFKEILEQDTKGRFTLTQHKYNDGSHVHNVYNILKDSEYIGKLSMYTRSNDQWEGVVEVYTVEDAELLNKVSRDIPFRVEITVKVK